MPGPYDFGYNPKHQKAQGRLERKQAQLDARFSRKMQELTHKTMIEQHRLDQIQKQIILEEERFNLQKLMDEQQQERALLNKIRHRQLDLQMSQERNAQSETDGKFSDPSKKPGLHAKINIPRDQVANMD